MIDNTISHSMLLLVIFIIFYMAINLLQLPQWAVNNPYEDYNPNLARHRQHATKSGEFLKYQLTQYILHTNAEYHHYRYIVQWVQTSTQTHKYSSNTIRTYSSRIKLSVANEVAQAESNDDIDIIANNTNNQHHDQNVVQRPNQHIENVVPSMAPATLWRHGQELGSNLMNMNPNEADLVQILNIASKSNDKYIMNNFISKSC